MNEKDLKLNFRYLSGNMACLSVDSVSGESVHNDIDNEEAIIIFNSLVGEKEDCLTVKKMLKENQQLKEQLELSEQIREKQKDRMNRVKDKIQSVAYGGSEDYYIGIINEIHKLLCVIKEKKE